MKKLLALLLALMLVLTMAACGSDEKTDDKKGDDTSAGEKVEDTNTEAPSTSAPSEDPTETPSVDTSDLSTLIVGKWNVTMKGTDVANAMKALLGEAADAFDFSGLTKSFSIQYDFNASGVVRISFDAESMKETYAEIYTAMGIAGSDLDAAVEVALDSAKGEFDKQAPYAIDGNTLTVSGTTYGEIEIIDANNLTMTDSTNIPLAMTRVA